MYLFSFIPHLSLSWIDPYFFLRLSSQQWFTCLIYLSTVQGSVGEKLPVNVPVSCHLNLAGNDLFWCFILILVNLLLLL